MKRGKKFRKYWQSESEDWKMWGKKVEWHLRLNTQDSIRKGELNWDHWEEIITKERVKVLMWEWSLRTQKKMRKKQQMVDDVREQLSSTRKYQKNRQQRMGFVDSIRLSSQMMIEWMKVGPSSAMWLCTSKFAGVERQVKSFPVGETLPIMERVDKGRPTLWAYSWLSALKAGPWWEQQTRHYVSMWKSLSQPGKSKRSLRHFYTYTQLKEFRVVLALTS